MTEPNTLAASFLKSELAPALRSAIDAFVVMDVMREANAREISKEHQYSDRGSNFRSTGY